MNQTAFLFPGQGSQSVGMLAGLVAQSEAARQVFEELSELIGYDMWQLVQDGPAERLNQTEVTQPAMLAAGLACWRAWKEAGGFDPAYMAGHSLGEYSALVAAGALQFADAVNLVMERAQRMQAATPAGTGAMAAIIGLEEDALNQVCAAAAEGQVVSCANLNSPGQVVIAGDKAAVDRACNLASEAGARRALVLAVSVPSHCALMREAAEQFKVSLSRTVFASNGIPVLHNVDARPRTDSTSIALALEQQLWQPVRWADTILELSRLGVTWFAECGPGKVLAGLNRRIVDGAESVSLTDMDSMNQTRAKWS